MQNRLAGSYLALWFQFTSFRTYCCIYRAENKEPNGNVPISFWNQCQTIGIAPKRPELE